MNNKTSRNDVYIILNEERDYQDSKHGTIEDEPHSIGDWLTFIRYHLRKAEDNLSTGNSHDSLSSIRKITALGIACMEQHSVPKRFL